MNATQPQVRISDAGIVQVTTQPGCFEAGRFDWQVEVGRTTSVQASWLDRGQGFVDLSTATATLNIRATHSGTVMLALSSAAPSPAITLDSNNEPMITWTVTAAQTAAFTFTRGVYELLITIGTTVTRLLDGTVAKKL